jgi:histidinol-phosphate aminotransferase
MALPADWIRAVVRAVPPYTPGEQPAAGRRVIKLNTNENPYPPSPAVLEALHEAIDARVRLYPDPEAVALRAEASGLYGVPVDCIMAGNGSDELLALLLRAVVDPGDRVAFPVPTYSLYETLVAVQGGVVVNVPWPSDWSLPPELATSGAKLTFLCNPNSPSGTLVPLDRIDDLAGRLAGVLVVDEAYVDFAAGNALGLVGRRPNVVVLRTLSKSYSLAGLRVGLAFGTPELLRGLRTVKDSYNLNRLSQVAATAALMDQSTLQANVARVARSRTRLTASLRALGYVVPESHANFVLARRPGVDQGPLARALAERDILVRHFTSHGLGDALRITVGTDDEIDALLTAMNSPAKDGPR